MSRIRIGQFNHLTELPVCNALEEVALPSDVEIVKGSPTQVNKWFLDHQLEVTSLSSIEYVRNIDKCMIIPNMSASADGPTHSILLFSEVPVTELDGKKIGLTTQSAAAAAVLRVLFDHYYHLEADFISIQPDFECLLSQGDGVLLIGDEAMRAHQKVISENLPFQITDLGEVWKQFTGEKLVYALWVVHRGFAKQNPEAVQAIYESFLKAKHYAGENRAALIKKSRRRTGLPLEVLEAYSESVNCEFTEDHRRALLTYYDYCYKSGLIDERVRLAIWGEESV